MTARYNRRTCSSTSFLLQQSREYMYAVAASVIEYWIEYFIFGHRHIPFDIQIAEKSRVICLGDWIGNFTYGVFDGEEFQLKKYLEDQGSIIKQ